MTQENKDLCKTCEHYWLDFPLPLDRIEAHCEILDEKYDGYPSKDENGIVELDTDFC